MSVISCLYVTVLQCTETYITDFNSKKKNITLLKMVSEGVLNVGVLKCHKYFEVILEADIPPCYHIIFISINSQHN